ncbi:hypothetical protein [Azohydromonas aeria]|uniref:hypothetical protein n=1 Tax=Azohydromonas aeria TaxID=2590212 RepID=UPI0012FBB642|nr:hypothetical protein [Azohydromonas aeria]
MTPINSMPSWQAPRTPSGTQTAIRFQALGQTVQVHCTDAAVARVVVANFAALPAAAPHARTDLAYEAGTAPQGSGYLLHRAGREPLAAASLCELLFDLEKDLIIALQWRRPELLHLHAAALEYAGQAWLLAGDSGAGKSTTTWGLLHQGFRYLSDELSPVDLESLCVHAYPHALCLKRRPPATWRFPEEQLVDLGRTLHVPVAALPGGTAATGPSPLAGLLFVRHDPALREPALRPLHPAEAGARLYVTTLNALAHARHGMDAVVGLAKSIPCWTLAAADLGATCALVEELARGLQPAQRACG